MIRPLSILAYAAISAAVLTVPAVVQAEDAPELDKRPRIGLVLGGGGARGAAHIGVLKELERQQIPIDAIAGTSMGAIVGGLYATGMSADELENLVSSMDWAAALSDIPDREYLSFRRKQDDREFPNNFEFGVRGTDILLPQGFIQGHKLDLLLRELTLHASHVADFDKLPIPFRAIASDIVTGEMVVLGSGDLAQSIRASMSVPGVFDPVSHGAHLLVDGGLTGNLPVDVVREMGVDIVIAVDVEFPLYASEELDSVVTISEQILTMLIRKETLRQIDALTESDILIRPDLGTFASTNFTGIVDAVEPGRAAAEDKAPMLARHAVDDEAWHAYVTRRGTTGAIPEKIDFVRVVHDDTLAAPVLESRLSVGPGDAVDPAVLAENANRMYGLQLYEQVGYRLVEEDGRTGVEYTATKKSWGPNFLQFGISLEDDLDGSTNFNLAARLTRAGLNRLGAEWRTDAQLGTDPALLSEFYQPLSFDSRWFVAPHVQTRQSNLNTFAIDATVARYRITNTELGIDVGRELGEVGEFRIGAWRGGGNARVKVGDPLLPNFDFETGGTFAQLRIDSVDNARFPRRGMQADIRWKMSRPGLGADHRFDTLEADISQTWSRGKSSLQAGVGFATTLSGTSSVQDYFPLGGFLRLSGLERGEIAGPHSALARLVYYRRVGDSMGGVMETPLYFGMSVEAGNVWQSRSDMSLDTAQVNGSLFAGLDTYFGPLFLAAGLAENGKSNIYLFIGSPPR